MKARQSFHGKRFSGGRPGGGAHSGAPTSGQELDKFRLNCRVDLTPLEATATSNATDTTDSTDGFRARLHGWRGTTAMVGVGRTRVLALTALRNRVMSVGRGVPGLDEQRRAACAAISEAMPTAIEQDRQEPEAVRLDSPETAR